MPEKQNENRIMAMLERTGLVRKTVLEDDYIDEEASEAYPQAEADLRSMFNQTSSESIKVTPAARQPVPGMPSPIIPTETSGAIEQPRPVAPPAMREQPKPVPPPPMVREQPRPLMHDQYHPVQAPPPDPLSLGFRSFEDGSSWDEPPREMQTEPGAAYTPPQPQPATSYIDRYLDIDELYIALSLKSKRTDTIYLVEEYLKTLPESLPDESRREIVNKIVAASGFDYDLLLGDGVLRVKMLKEYAERFARYTDDYVSERQTELDELDQQIMRIRRLIENRRELHKKQFFAIEAEAQRLKEILTFISG